MFEGNERSLDSPRKAGRNDDLWLDLCFIKVIPQFGCLQTPFIGQSALGMGERKIIASSVSPQ